MTTTRRQYAVSALLLVSAAAINAGAAATNGHQVPSGLADPAAVLYGNQLWLFGGRDVNGKLRDDVVSVDLGIADAPELKVKRQTSLPHPADNLVPAIHSGRVALFGLEAARESSNAEKVLKLKAAVDEQHHIAAQTTAWVYDVAQGKRVDAPAPMRIHKRAADSIADLAQMQPGRSAAAAISAQKSDGLPVYAFGGEPDRNVAPLLEFGISPTGAPHWDDVTAASSSAEGQDAPSPRTHAAVARVNATHVVVSGGRDATGALLRDTWFYDGHRRWTRGPDMAAARAGHAAAALRDGRFLVQFGGYTDARGDGGVNVTTRREGPGAPVWEAHNLATGAVAVAKETWTRGHAGFAHARAVEAGENLVVAGGHLWRREKVVSGAGTAQGQAGDIVHHAEAPLVNVLAVREDAATGKLDLLWATSPAHAPREWITPQVSPKQSGIIAGGDKSKAGGTSKAVKSDSQPPHSQYHDTVHGSGEAYSRQFAQDHAKWMEDDKNATTRIMLLAGAAMAAAAAFAAVAVRTHRKRTQVTHIKLKQQSDMDDAFGSYEDRRTLVA